MWVIVGWCAQASPITVALPLSGKHHTDVELPAFGRVSVTARSSAGVRIQLVDRLLGPGQASGTIGETDGRIDGFLDRGPLRVLTEGPAGLAGDFVLDVVPSERLGAPLQLLQGTTDSTELEDHTERAWWLDVTDGKSPVHVEVIGRHVADLRLWRDGSWLVGHTPVCRTIEAVVGEPIQQCVLSGRLERGLYQLLAYGGPGQPWAVERPDTSVQVRWDVEDVGESGERVGRIGPTGRVHLRVPSATNNAFLALPEQVPAALHLVREGSSPFLLGAPTASITDEDRTPTAFAQVNQSGTKILSITGRPGQPYALRWYPRGIPTLPEKGEVLLTSMSTADPQDSLPPTMVLSHTEGGKTRLIDTVAVEVASGEVWTHRFNLLEPTDLLLRVRSKATYDIALDAGRITLEPLFLGAPPKGYTSPAPRDDRWQQELSAGVYRVQLSPKTAGIATLSIALNDWSDLAGGLMKGRTPISGLPEIRLATTLPASAKLFGPLEQRGLRVDPLPLDLSSSKGIPLAAGERLTLPVTTDRTRRMEARLPNGERLPLEWLATRGPEVELRLGSWPLVLDNSNGPATVVVLAEVPSATRLTALPEDRRRALPDFPLLTQARAQSLDLERASQKTLQLRVDSGGLFHLQSTGLLATKGTLRSRVTPVLATQTANGIGRNFQIGEYLLPGDYQVTVGVEGSSAGHAGVELRPVPMLDGGTLTVGPTARHTVPAGTGLTMDLVIDRREQVYIRSGNPQGTFPCRLEDAEGWPVIRPTNTCEFTVELEPGRYRLRGLPSDLPSIRHTFAQIEVPPVVHSGDGPFVLPLDTVVHGLWTEKTGTDERPTHLWGFTMPATDTVTLTVSDDMGGELRGPEGVLSVLRPGRPWTGVLPAGPITLALQSRRPDTGVPYNVHLTTEHLLAGSQRELYEPARLPVRVGQTGQVTFRSEGSADVSARLLDAEGEVLAANDDRPDGWNMQISSWLPPGDYTLEVNNVTGEGTTVFLDAPLESVGPALAFKRALALPFTSAPTVHLLEGGDGRADLEVRVDADQNADVSVEMEVDGSWRRLASGAGRNFTLIARRFSKRPVRVRVFATDNRDGTATVTVGPADLETPNETQLAAGLGGKGHVLIGSQRVRPGFFRLQGDRLGVMLCAEPGVPCEPAPSIVALDARAALFGPSLRAERVDLTQPTPIVLGAVPAALATGAEGRVAAILRSGSNPVGLALSDKGATAPGVDAAIAVGEGAVQLWGDGGARLQVVPLERHEQVWDGETVLSLVLPPRSETAITLGRGQRWVTVDLERSLAVVAGPAAVWADETSQRATLPMERTIQLVNPGLSEGLAVLRPASSRPTLTEDGVFEAVAQQPGTLVLPVEVEGGLLRAHDAELSMITATASQAGTSLAAHPGLLTVRHGAGPFAVWSEHDGKGPHRADGVDVPLAGAGVTRLQAASPFVVELGQGARRQVQLRPSGGFVDVPHASAATVRVRPFGESPPPAITQEAVTVTPIQEGLGPQSLLTADRPAWYQLDVEHAGPLGFGVAAAADRATATLLDHQGQPVASGVIAMATLEPGTYHLVLSIPPDSPPVRVRPAVSGLTPPDHGPPREVVEHYLSLAHFTPDGVSP